MNPRYIYMQVAGKSCSKIQDPRQFFPITLIESTKIKSSIPSLMCQSPRFLHWAYLVYPLYPPL